MEDSVRKLRVNREGSHTHLKDKHFKTWLREAYQEKEETTLPKTSKWMKLMELVQFMWEHGNIPEDLVWTILILTPKVNTDTRWIGLLGVLCKVTEAIIDKRIKKAMTFHDILHGFCAGRGMRTAIMELNLTEELASVD